MKKLNKELAFYLLTVSILILFLKQTNITTVIVMTDAVILTYLYKIEMVVREIRNKHNDRE